MTTNTGYSEGETCNRNGCAGIIGIHPVENCSCHIAPPCGACTSPRAYCPVCDWQEEDEPIEQASQQSAPVKPFAFPKRRTVADLDRSKIDWIGGAHTNFSMIKEGVYPESASREDVEKEVRGTFGGRFAYFGGGNFKYIAYTD